MPEPVGGNGIGASGYRLQTLQIPNNPLLAGFPLVFQALYLETNPPAITLSANAAADVIAN